MGWNNALLRHHPESHPDFSPHAHTTAIPFTTTHEWCGSRRFRVPVMPRTAPELNWSCPAAYRTVGLADNVIPQVIGIANSLLAAVVE